MSGKAIAFHERSGSSPGYGTGARLYKGSKLNAITGSIFAANQHLVLIGLLWPD